LFNTNTPSESYRNYLFRNV